MKAKEFIPASKPRNFVVKNQKTAGAGAHKDKKRAEKQGDVKHKQKQFEQGVAEVSQQTLQSYRKKAAKEKNDAMDIVNRDDVDDATWAKNVNKASQRKDGIAAANKRLGVAEVSKATIDRYVSKASDAHGDADFKARMSKNDPDKRSYHVDQKKTAEKRRQGISRALDRMSREESIEEGDNDWSGSQGNFAGDKPVNLGGAVSKRLDIDDVVSYFGEKATILAMSKDRTVSRINLKSGITQNVKTSDLKRVGHGMGEATSVAVRMQRAADKQRAKSDASLARTPSSIPKKEEPKKS
jgi:hypothetical protein